MYKYLIILAIIILSVNVLSAAPRESGPFAQETVSFLETTNFNDAVQILETFSWKYERKKIINLSAVNDAIGIPIHNLTWRKTLELLVLKKDLMIEETVGAIMIKNREAPVLPGQISAPVMQSEINTKQVRISAIAFTCDRAYLKSLGIDWSTLLDGRVNAEINLNTAQLVPGAVSTVDFTRNTGIDGQSIEINTLLSTIEANELGSVIAKPSVVVSSGKKGFIQVGQDVSVKSVDDAGNTIDRFFSTGVIMDVKPTVLIAEPDGIEVVHLIASVERSSATPGTISTVINKNISTTDIILYDGEEVAIGGLYNTEELKVRSGIPFLKDLPWWVFGIRYLTGFTKIEKKERELVIIIKAEIMDNAITRLKNKQSLIR